VSRHRDEHLDLCAAHVLGVLDEAGRVELEAHLATGCEVCHEELRALSGGATVLAMSTPPLRAPAELRERVLAAAMSQPADTPDEIPVVARPAPPPPVVLRPERASAGWAALAWGLAAAAALLAVAGVFTWQRAVRLDRELATARTQALELQRSLEDERAWAGLAGLPGTRIVRLDTTPDGDSSLVAQVIYHSGVRRAMVVAERFSLPADRAYELWAITASGPTSLGVVHPDREGRVVARLEQVDAGEPIAAFAFSLESSGGSPDHHKPSGPVVMVGHVGG
jgi:anti-sigma-K factor RskA